MDRTETLGIMSLLNALYSASPHPEKSREKVKAWTLALGAYSFEQVKRAALDRVAENRFFPDVAELIEYIPRAERNKAGVGKAPRQEKARAGMDPMPESILLWYEGHRRLCREEGIPTAAEAKAQGMCFAKYCALAEEHGM